MRQKQAAAEHQVRSDSGNGEQALVAASMSMSQQHEKVERWLQRASRNQCGFVEAARQPFF